MNSETGNSGALLQQAIDETVNTAFEMMKQGKSLEEILARLIRTAENIAGNESVSSILLLDQEGLLRNGCSPQLPFDYLKAIDGLKPHPAVGTCASAAATGNMVMTPDFKSDDKWSELRHLPLSLGFSGAWSMPIKTADGKVLGTFGTYYRQNRKPSPDEVSAVKKLAEAAATVIENRV